MLEELCNVMVFLGIFGVNKDIVYIDKHKLMKEFLVEIMHKLLEHWESIDKSVRYYQVLVLTSGSEEIRLPFISSSNPHRDENLG